MAGLLNAFSAVGGRKQATTEDEIRARAGVWKGRCQSGGVGEPRSHVGQSKRGLCRMFEHFRMVLQ